MWGFADGESESSSECMSRDRANHTRRNLFNRSLSYLSGLCKVPRRAVSEKIASFIPPSFLWFRGFGPGGTSGVGFPSRVLWGTLPTWESPGKPGRNGTETVLFREVPFELILSSDPLAGARSAVPTSESPGKPGQSGTRPSPFFFGRCPLNSSYRAILWREPGAPCPLRRAPANPGRAGRDRARSFSGGAL